MDNRIDKDLVRRRFARSLASYGREAVVQQRIAGELAGAFSRSAPAAMGSLLEIGCGTGFLTSQVLDSHTVGKLYINDIVEEALPALAGKITRAEVSCIAGDAESVEFPTGLDAVVSASTVQWFDDLPAFAARSAAALKKGGVFAFNTFSCDNLHQIRALTGEGLDCYSVHEIRRMLVPYFSQEEVFEQRYEQHFDTPLEVLHHLRRTGVTGTGKFRWTKSRLAQFEKNYTELYGGTLTWHVIYAVCKK